MTVTVIFLCLNKSLRSLKTFDICVTCCLVMNSGWTITTNATSQTTLNLWRYLHAALPTSFKLLHLDFWLNCLPWKFDTTAPSFRVDYDMNPIKFLLCNISYSLNCWHKANSVVEGRMHAIGLLSQRFDMTSWKGSLLLRLFLSDKNFWICSNSGLTMTWIHQNSNVQFIILVLLT